MFSLALAVLVSGEEAGFGACPDGTVAANHWRMQGGSGRCVCTPSDHPCLSDGNCVDDDACEGLADPAEIFQGPPGRDGHRGYGGRGGHHGGRGGHRDSSDCDSSEEDEVEIDIEVVEVDGQDSVFAAERVREHGHHHIDHMHPEGAMTADDNAGGDPQQAEDRRHTNIFERCWKWFVGQRCSVKALVLAIVLTFVCCCAFSRKRKRRLELEAVQAIQQDTAGGPTKGDSFEVTKGGKTVVVELPTKAVLPKRERRNSNAEIVV